MKHGASCTHVDINTAEIFGIRGYRVHKKGKCESNRKAVWKKKRNFNGEQFWARGYAVSTVGFEEEKVKDYIKHQEQLDGLGSGKLGEF